VGVTSVTQSPLPGTPLAVGTTEVTITAVDAAGNEAEVSFSLVVRPAAPELQTIVASGTPVPAAGNDPRIAEGSKWTELGTPAMSDTGKMVFVGKWAGDSRKAQSGTGVFIDGNLFVAAGEAVPGAGADGVPTTAVFKSFKDPVVSGDGIAFIATIAGAGVQADADTAVLSNSRAGSLEIIAREGGVAPGTNGALFKSFANVSMQSGTTTGTLFTAVLRTARGGSPVTAANDQGAWWTAGNAPLTKLAREGDAGFAPDEIIHSFDLLRAVNGSAGHGRGHLTDELALFRMVTRRGGVVRDGLVLGTPESLTELARTGDGLNSTQLPGAKWATLSLPSASFDGMHAALLGTVATDGATITKANAKGIFGTSDHGETWEPIARITGQVEGFPQTAAYSQLYDPVHSSTKAAVAFIGTAKGNGIASNANDGIWWKAESGPVQLIAREGDQPPNAAGAKWKSFINVAFPGGDSGPLFEASLAPGFPTGSDRVTAKNDRGLYAVDSFGNVCELLRENQLIGGKAVKTFTVLKAALGSAGSSRSFNAAGHVGVVVTFGDGSRAIVRVTVP
jgi:hypothetical protein